MAESGKSEERQINQRISHHGGVRDVLMVVRSQTEGSLPRKSQQPPQKKWHLRACSRGEKVTSNGTQVLGVGTLLNQLFPCIKLQDEVIEHVWTGKGPEGLTILADLGLPGYPHLRKRPCATKTSDVFQLSLIVSTRPDSAAQKMGVKPLLSLISTLAPRFRKASVAAILVQKTSLTPQNFGSKFPRDESERWCVGSKLLRVLNLFWGMKIPSINCQWHVSMYLATRLLGYAAA